MSIENTIPVQKPDVLNGLRDTVPPAFSPFSRERQVKGAKVHNPNLPSTKVYKLTPQHKVIFPTQGDISFCS